ncbi:MAG: hypothetical protein WAK20_14325, partial [Candidatus Acidiferrum sp.]
MIDQEQTYSAAVLGHPRRDGFRNAQNAHLARKPNVRFVLLLAVILALAACGSKKAAQIPVIEFTKIPPAAQGG